MVIPSRTILVSEIVSVFPSESHYCMSILQLDCLLMFFDWFTGQRTKGINILFIIIMSRKIIRMSGGRYHLFLTPIIHRFFVSIGILQFLTNF